MTHPTTVMDPLDPLSLLERARQELQAGKIDRAEFALELFQCHMQQRQMQPPAPAAPAVTPKPRPQSVQPALALRKECEKNPLYEPICEYLQTRIIGDSFNHAKMRDYFLGFSNVKLDMAPDSTGYPRFHYHLSKALERLKRNGFLRKGDKRTSYVVVKHP